MKYGESQIDTMALVLVKHFGITTYAEAQDKARIIIDILNKEPGTFIKASERLPEPGLLSEPCEPYYIVKIPGFGEQKAMFLQNAKGEINWYTSYVSQLIVPVYEWREQIA